MYEYLCSTTSLQIHHTCLYFVSVHQTAPPLCAVPYDCSLLLIYRPREDERLSWPS